MVQEVVYLGGVHCPEALQELMKMAISGSFLYKTTIIRD